MEGEGAMLMACPDLGWPVLRLLMSSVFQAYNRNPSRGRSYDERQLPSRHYDFPSHHHPLPPPLAPSLPPLRGGPHSTDLDIYAIIPTTREGGPPGSSSSTNARFCGEELPPYGRHDPFYDPFPPFGGFMESCFFYL